MRLGVRLGRDHERGAAVIEPGRVASRHGELVGLHLLWRVLGKGRLEL